ncbi:hypothetical protein NHJ13051_000369 [Beauveria bassiana]
MLESICSSLARSPPPPPPPPPPPFMSMFASSNEMNISISSIPPAGPLASYLSSPTRPLSSKCHRPSARRSARTSAGLTSLSLSSKMRRPWPLAYKLLQHRGGGTQRRVTRRHRLWARSSDWPAAAAKHTPDTKGSICALLYPRGGGAGPGPGPGDQACLQPL